MATARSHSSLAKVSLAQKWRETLTFLRWRFFEPVGPERFDFLFDQIDGYREIYERLTGRRFAEARLLEIGYGARPLRLLAVMSMGIDVRGIDLDMPMLRFSPVRLFHILQTNGPERALKTAARNLFFDGRDQKNLRTALEQRGHKLRLEPSRFLVGDATTYDYGTGTIDLIYSEDVFEHIPQPDLERLVARLAAALSPNGVALITPNIFTGITGGHLPEWYLHLVDSGSPKRSEPWDHLRRGRYTANTYLNKLPRSAYRQIFSRHFEILEEKVMQPALGRPWLTAEVRQELANWSEEELFSNQVQFVLRHR